MSDDTATQLIGEGENLHIRFTCWNCKTTSEVHLNDVQQERIDIKYTRIRPNSAEPKKYFVRCEACSRFTSVTF